MDAMLEQLIYKSGPPAHWQGMPGLWVSGHPIQFLERASLDHAKGLVVYVEGETLQHRAEALELCAALTEHPLAGRLPLVAVVSQRHRGLLASLALAGVRWVVFRPSGAKLPVRISPNNRGQSLSLVLEEICPFLNHEPVDEQRELAHCGAYLNRLVLGRERLLDVCQYPAHRDCPFFLAPRQAQGDD